MNDIFKIQYLYQKRSKAQYFEEEDYVDASPIFLCLEHFLAIYQGKFILQLGEFDLSFDLDPDLSTIFLELPDVLMSLTMEQEAPTELYFYEEGTDLNLVLHRKAGMITIRPIPGLMVGKQFKNLPESALSVPAEMFLEEWRDFLTVILEGLIEFNPALENETSYQEYYSRLLAHNYGEKTVARREDEPVLWTDAQQKRYFLIPDSEALYEGNFVLRTFTGGEQSVEPARLFNFEITELEAQQYVQAQMEQALEQTKSAFANLWGMAAQEALQTAIPAEASPDLDTDLIDFTPDELRQNPEILKEWLGRLFGGIKTFLQNITPKYSAPQSETMSPDALATPLN